MILVTVGSQLPFDRLVRAVETWARAAGRTDVVFQVGDGGHRHDGFEAVARREALGETRNDHQVATRERFRTRDGGTGTADEADLPARIVDALRTGPPAEALGPFARGPLVERLRSFLEEFVERPGAKR